MTMRAQCNVCGEEFQGLDDLVKHFNEEHVESSDIEEFCEDSDKEAS